MANGEPVQLGAVSYTHLDVYKRQLLEGAPQVKLFGETIEVQAELCQLTGM